MEIKDWAEKEKDLHNNFMQRLEHILTYNEKRLELRINKYNNYVMNNKELPSDFYLEAFTLSSKYRIKLEFYRRSKNNLDEEEYWRIPIQYDKFRTNVAKHITNE
jgi:hypothetical protein